MSDGMLLLTIAGSIFLLATLTALGRSLVARRAHKDGNHLIQHLDH